MVSLVVALLISLINIGSSTALNAIFSLATGSIITSYWITIFCVLIRRMRGPLPYSRFSLGKWGVVINAAALLYLAPLYVFAFFPSNPHPTAQTMNWGIVMYGGVAIFAAIYYVLWGRKAFSPPDDAFEHLLKTDYSAETSDEASSPTVFGNDKHLEKELGHEVREGG